MEREAVNTVSLSDGTEIRAWYDEIESESPLNWNDDSRYYRHGESDFYYNIKCHSLENLEEDYPVKKGLWVVAADIHVDSCPGFFLTGKVRPLRSFSMSKFEETLNDEFYNGDNSQGVLVVKASSQKEAVGFIHNFKKDMDMYLNGETLVLDHGRVNKCGECGHESWESMDAIGDCYIDVNDEKFEEDAVDTFGLDKALLKECKA